MQEMDTDHEILRHIHEGMDVLDMNGDQIGTVKSVFMGNLSDDVIEMGGTGAESPDIDLSGDDSLVETLARALVPKTMPKELAERLLNNGYMMLDSSGLFTGDRFVMPDQIAGVYEGSVRLNTTHDHLLNP